ncbi:hypothetical protein TRIP_B40310 [uncultured Desulfatiglans sp.]|uniref:Uncharacterized protein n=1 Tax=Uncultured Desulfatiglans sp. TaxID=1748965 RepID=A0A653AEH7_UNCDX|nr:hypothetical protein TRIP_B40310 [uncultured Desulfatiglans sp.]
MVADARHPSYVSEWINLAARRTGGHLKRRNDREMAIRGGGNALDLAALKKLTVMYTAIICEYQDPIASNLKPRFPQDRSIRHISHLNPIGSQIEVFRGFD